MVCVVPSRRWDLILLYSRRRRRGGGGDGGGLFLIIIIIIITTTAFTKQEEPGLGVVSAYLQGGRRGKSIRTRVGVVHDVTAAVVIVIILWTIIIYININYYEIILRRGTEIWS